MAASVEDAPIKLESYASISAEIEAGRGADTVLEREGIQREKWAAAQAFWLKLMADEALRKRFEATTRYQALFNAKKKVFDAKLRSEKQRAERKAPAAPPVEAVLAASDALAKPLIADVPRVDLPEPPKIAPAPPPPVWSPPQAVVAPPARETARPEPVRPETARPEPFRPEAARPEPFLPEPARPPPIAASPPAFVPSALAAAAPAPVAQAAMPFRPAPAGASAPQVFHPAPEPVKKKQNLGATMGIQMDDLARAVSAATAVPFKPDALRGPPAVQPLSPSPSAGTTGPLEIPPGLLPKKQNLGATMSIDMDQLRDNATPFQTRPQVPPAPPPPGADDDDDDAPRTAMISPGAIAQAIAQATPFRGADDPTKEPRRGASGSPRTVMFDASQIPGGPQALPFGRPPSGEHPAVGLPFAQAASPPAAANAAPAPVAAPAHALAPGSSAGAPSAAPGARRFSINVFASLTAEIAETPGEADAIRQRYGLSDAEHREESHHWNQEFATNDDLRQRYLGIVQRYRGYVKQRSGK